MQGLAAYFSSFLKIRQEDVLLVRTYADICFKSDLAHLSEMLKSILSFVTSKYPDISSDDLFDLRLIYNELLLNAIIHGNKKDCAKTVHVTVEAAGDCIKSIVSDEGGGFDYNDILYKQETLNDPFSESGRGIRIARSLSNTLTFGGGGNIIMFTKKLSQQEVELHGVITALAFS